jgi:hypothetical protein
MAWKPAPLAIKAFHGINTFDPPHRMPVSPRTGMVDLVKGENIDLDETGQASRRDGYALKVAGTDCHSLFSDGVTCVYVEGDQFKQLYLDYTTSTLRSGLTVGARMAYWAFNERIYYTNGVIIGYLTRGPEGVLQDNVFPDPAVTYKRAPFPGQLLCVYRSRLYVAQGSRLWFSDVAALGRLDLRRGFIQMDGLITLLNPVKDGLYVADGKTYFLAGAGGQNLTRVMIAEYNAIPGTAAMVDGKLIGPDGLPEKVVAWTSEKGICVGSSGGEFQNLTLKKYQMGVYQRGAGLFRQRNGIQQYVAILSS